MVTITVTDVNEAPSVMGAASIDHAENGTELDTDAETDDVEAAIYTATDVDADDAAADLKWTCCRVLMPASSASPTQVPCALSPSRRSPTTSLPETRAEQRI